MCVCCVRAQGSVRVHVFFFCVCVTRPAMGLNLDWTLAGFIDLLLIKSLQTDKDIGHTDIPASMLCPLPPDTGQDYEEYGTELQDCNLKHAQVVLQHSFTSRELPNQKQDL